MSAVEEGLNHIKDFFVRFGQGEAYARSNEVKVLKRFGREIRRKMPVNPIAQLKKRLDRAIRKLRDSTLRRPTSRPCC